MTSATARLHLMKTASTTDADVERNLTALTGIDLDDGRLAHPATHGLKRGAAAPRSRQESENELVGFVCDLLQAPDETVGTVAAGLVESALLVMRAARDARPSLKRPTVVLPQSAHPAWFAAAASVGVVPVVAPIASDEDLRTDESPVRQARPAIEKQQ